MATKEEVAADMSDFDESLTGLLARLDIHKARMRETITELRAGMNNQHAANRLAKMGRELYGEGWE